jgi:hypothetical protein
MRVQARYEITQFSSVYGTEAISELVDKTEKRKVIF